MPGMSGFMTAAIVIGLVAVLGVLLTGVVSMLRGGEWNRKHGNQLMRWRVILQFGTVILLLIFFLLYGH
ncbi:MAG TPA: twin transmembrane helix small protein [Candidatus Cybelea sp.]|nr:twin transmembrane helix small protein [Candidatus Cybelea sp.]